MNPAVQMLGISKKFPGVLANNNIDFIVEKGEIHGLLGENGAGKTVLMSILYGLYKPDSGKIIINGKEVVMDSPATAIKQGIGMVHQHFMLVPSLTVTENVILGKENVKNGFFLDIKNSSESVKKFSEQFGLEIDPDATIESLSVGAQQRVEILKALYRGAEILILDEPTAILIPQEVDKLLDAIKSLKKQGKTIIFITHKLREVFAICDRITVLKKGNLIGTVKKDETNSSQLAKMMVDKQILETFEKKKIDQKDVILKIEELNVRDNRGIKVLKGLDLEIRSYEILGLAGVEGNGQSELVESMMGLRRKDSGKILLNGVDIGNFSPKDRIRSGLSHIPEDRQKCGLILDFSVMENLILGSHNEEPNVNRNLVINLEETCKLSENLVKDYSISTPNIQTYVKNLSGGTQQRVVLAREFSRKPKIVIAYQPTRGLDIGATEYVRSKLIEMRDQGSGVLLISADLDEIRALSDKIAVIFDGKIVAIKDPSMTNEEDLGLLMAGGKIG